MGRHQSCSPPHCGRGSRLSCCCRQSRRAQSGERASRRWASIIGSGFLVVAPLLALVVGWAAPLAMLVIVVIAYGLGEISRFNIRHGEPLLQSGEAPALLMTTRASREFDPVAGLCRIRCVLHQIVGLLCIQRSRVGPRQIGAQVLTTLILIFIGYTGWRRGSGGPGPRRGVFGQP